MADVIVRTGEAELRTCKLTKSILKQMRSIGTFSDLQALIPVALRSPVEEQRLKSIEAKYSTPSGATEEERQEAQELASKPSFSAWMNKNVVGWLHGSWRGCEYERDLLVKVGDGDYVLYRNPHMDTIKKFKQILAI